MGHGTRGTITKARSTATESTSGATGPSTQETGPTTSTALRYTCDFGQKLQHSCLPATASPGLIFSCLLFKRAAAGQQNFREGQVYLERRSNI